MTRPQTIKAPQTLASETVAEEGLEPDTRIMIPQTLGSARRPFLGSGVASRVGRPSPIVSPMSSSDLRCPVCNAPVPGQDFAVAQRGSKGVQWMAHETTTCESCGAKLQRETRRGAEWQPTSGS